MRLALAIPAFCAAVIAPGAGCEEEGAETEDVADELIEERAPDEVADDRDGEETTDEPEAIEEELPEVEEPEGDGKGRPEVAEAAEDAKAEALQDLGDPEDAMEFARERWLAEEAVEDLSLRALSILRNAPFARAGLEFRTPWLAAYFWRAPETYEPGAFDEDEISELESANIHQIRAIEDGLEDAELEERWRALWEELGADPPEGRPWHWPEPWQHDVESRIEARLLAEALENPHPPDPLFDEGATRPLPRELGGIELGDTGLEDLEHAFSRRAETIEFLGSELEVGVREEDGEVVDIAAGEFHHPHDGRPMDPETQVESFEHQLRAIFGAPDERAVRSAWPPHDEPIWRADDRVLELGYLVAPEEAGPAMLLRPADPGRPCGPGDSFLRTLEGIARGFDDDDFDAVKEHVADPLVSQAVVYSEGGELPEEDLDELPFDEAHPLEDLFSVEEQGGNAWREDTRACAPLRARRVMMGSILSYVFGRDDDGAWHLGAMQEHVPGYRHEPKDLESALAEVCADGEEPCPCPEHLEAPGEFEVEDWQYAFLSDAREPDLVVSVSGCGHALTNHTLVFAPDPQSNSGWRPVELPLAYRLNDCEPHDVGGGREALGCAGGRTHMGFLHTHGAALSHVEGEFALARTDGDYSKVAGGCRVPEDEFADEALQSLRVNEMTPARASLELEIGRAELDAPEEHDGDVCEAQEAGWERPELEAEVESMTLEGDEILLEAEHAASLEREDEEDEET